MVVFILLVLLMNEHGKSFHLQISSSVYFFDALNSLLYKFFNCLIWVTIRIFYIVWAFKNGVVSRVLISVCHLITTLFLSAASLLKIFISYRSSLVEFLGSLMYIILSSLNRDYLTSFLTIFIPLVSFIVILFFLKL